MVANFLNPKCPKCGSSVKRESRFCPTCGEPLNSGLLKCGVCGVENRTSAKFCKNCGRPLNQSGAPEMIGNRWARREADFAARVEVNDLPGLLRRGLIVEPGTNAMLIEHGTNIGVMPPGEYDMDTIQKHLGDWLSGRTAASTTALLVSISPADLVFDLGNRYTSDPLPIALTIRLRAEVAEPAKFLINVLSGRERISLADLSQYVQPEIVQVADTWLRKHTLDELVNQPELKNHLELAIEDALRLTFGQSGLRFLQVRTLELNLQPYDEVKGIRGDTKLLIYKSDAQFEHEQTEEDIKFRRAQAEVDAKARYAELNHQVNLQALAEEGRRLEIEERRVELNQRMRLALTENRMNEIRTQADFEKFLEEIDHAKELRKEEHDALVVLWNDEKEDRMRARALLLAKMDAEADFDRRMQALIHEKDLDKTQLESEIELIRMRAKSEYEQKRDMVDQEIEIEKKRMAFQLEREHIEEERRKRQIEFDQMKHRAERAEDEADAELGLRLLKQMKENRREDEEATLRIRRIDEEERLRMQRENKLALDRAQADLEKEKFEQGLRERDAQRQFELNRIVEMGKLGAESLVALSGAEQGRILADMRKTDALKGMTEEQILAAAAADSPEVARALAEKFRAIADGKATQRETDLYERLLGDQKATLQMMREDADKRVHDVNEANARSQSTVEHAMDQLANTAQAFARNPVSTPPPTVVVVPGAGGPQIITPGGMAPGGTTAPQQTKFCPKCGKIVSADALHCEHCGNKFEGMV